MATYDLTSSIPKYYLLRAGDILKAGTILADSPGVKEGGGYGYGVNANLCLLNIPETATMLIRHSCFISGACRGSEFRDVLSATTIAHCHDLQSFLFFCFVILVELYNMILLILIVLTGTGIQNWKLSILNPELLQSGSEKNNLI